MSVDTDENRRDSGQDGMESGVRGSASPSSHGLLQPHPTLTVEERLLLHHAAVQVVADRAGVSILHFKGPIVGNQFPGDVRPSTDVDILLQPSDLTLLTSALYQHGWVATAAGPGAEWHHSRVLANPIWGTTVDLHTHYPGVPQSVRDFFILIADGSSSLRLAGIDCPIPARPSHALLLLLHAARSDSSRGPADVARVRSTLDSGEWGRLMTLAGLLRCRPALSAVLSEVEERSIEARLWSAIRDHPEAGVLRWAVRLLEADGAGRSGRLLIDAVGLGIGGGVRPVVSRLARGIRQTPRLLSALRRPP